MGDHPRVPGRVGDPWQVSGAGSGGGGSGSGGVQTAHHGPASSWLLSSQRWRVSPIPMIAVIGIWIRIRSGPVYVKRFFFFFFTPHHHHTDKKYLLLRSPLLAIRNFFL